MSSMYDDIVFIDGWPLCAAGHALRRLQSKDMEADAAQYYIKERRIYVRDPQRDPFDKIDIADMTMYRSEAVVVPDLTRDLLLYTQCLECRPILSFHVSIAYGDGIADHYPRAEFRLQANHGTITGLDAYRVETRDEIRARLLEGGSDVLDDDDRVAARHFELLAARATWSRKW